MSEPPQAFTANWRIVLTTIGVTCLMAGAAHATGIEVPFEFDHNEIFVEVRVNGQGPYRMLVDTGTSPSVIDRDVALKLGLKLGAVGNGSGAGTAEIRAQETLFDTLDVGSLHASKVEALSVDLAPIKAKLGPTLIGVLGYSLFRGRIVQFDYPHGKLRFLDTFAEPSVPPDKVVTLPFRLNEANGPIITAVLVKNRALTAILDTGSGRMLLFTPDGARRVGLADEIAKGKAVQSAGYAGRFSMIEGRVARVKIGTLTVEGPSATFTQKGTGYDNQVYDVNIGNALLKDFVVTFDYKKKRVTFAK